MYKKYNEEKGIWYVFNDNDERLVSYRDEYYGKYSKDMAIHTCKTGEILKNYYIIKNKKVIMVVYSKKHGYKKVRFNIEHLKRVNNYKWFINEDHNTFYCRTETIHANKKKNIKSKKISLHRYILDLCDNNDDVVVDHIDRNGLNNLNNNLRIISKSLNQRNKYYKGKCNFNNVYKDKDKWVTGYRDNEGKVRRKSFSINKYGDRLAYLKACQMSVSMRKQHGYIVDENDILILTKKRL